MVIPVEDSDPGELRKAACRWKRYGGDARVDRGDASDGLLLDTVGGDSANLGEHVLARVEDSPATAQGGLAAAEDVEREANARLKLFGLIR